ncbi:hypothetical protein J3A83DRAFT_4085274 [Scleroderma citrinum]
MHPNPSPSSAIRASKRARNALEAALDNHTVHGTPDDPPPSTRKTHSKKQPLSCAECRRLKLKCDRVFPCQSCSKRGCAEICPDGALTSGKGSRFILANTEQLHAKIIQMSDRIRQLEDALGKVQAKCAPDSHPLLQQDLLQIKNSLELYSPQHAISRPSHLDTATLPTANHQDGSPDHSQSRQSEVPFRVNPHFSMENMILDEPSRLPPEIEKLSQTFPYPWLPNNPMRERIYEMLPPRKEAEYLCTQARLNALWQYNLDPSETWLPNLVHHVYTTPIKDISFRRLSLLFIMMATGTLVDLNQPNDSPRAEIYHRLARASLCEMNLMDEPSFDLLQTLFYMIWYLLIFSDKSRGVAYAWSIMGLAVKLAQSVSFLSHRDGNRKVIPEESERRRMLFWELLSLDARLALSLGRPPSICLDHVDCKRPSYTFPEVHSAGGLSYHEWKHGFFQDCLTPVLNAVVSAQQKSYSKVLDVDRAVRNYPIPPMLDVFRQEAAVNNRQLVMQQVLVSCGREIVLLQLHRNFFTEALNNYDAFSYRHELAPSVVATYCSATRLIATLTTMEEREPLLSKRFMSFWFNAFSGAVALSLIVSRTPFLSLAPWALQELGIVHHLFSKVAEKCSKVAQALPLLTKIAEKSRRSYVQWQNATVDRTQMEVDDLDECLRDTRVLTNRGTASFDGAHFDLLQCLRDIERRRPPSLHDLPPFVSQTRPSSTSWSDSEMHLEQSADHDLSVDMLALALGRPAELKSVRHVSDSTTSCAGPQRVGNHTFNFDFGALASNVENQSSTYMTWF